MDKLRQLEGLPPEVFELIPHLYPSFVHICEICGLSGVEFFLLSYVKRFGTALPFGTPQHGGRLALPLKELYGTVFTIMGYSGETAAERIASRLEDDGYLARASIRDDAGKRKMAILLDRGHEALERFNRSVDELFVALTPARPRRILKIIWRLFPGISREVLDRARLEATRLRNVRLEMRDDADAR